VIKKKILKNITMISILKKLKKERDKIQSKDIAVFVRLFLPRNVI